MGKVIRTSEGPVPGIPIKPSLQAQQPGEVLIGYEVEAAGGCQLNLLGWCCFGALVCTAFPLSWLPFICSSCKKHYQRPVYGYPMSSMSFIASDAVASGAAKPAASSAVAAPTILCMDATLEMQSLPQHDQQQEPVMQQSQPQPQQQPEPQLQQLCASPRANFLPCSPSPPPMSIFVPPSLVPASGFTADNPFPPRYSPVPTALQGSPSASLACSVLPISGSPRLAKVTGTCGPAPQSPGPGAGLPMMGGHAFGLSV